MIYSGFKGGRLSKLGMGGMRLPGTVGSLGHINRRRAMEVIDLTMESGINYYDTAHIYGLGDSERFLGEALSRYPRESYHIATKYNILGGGKADRQFEKQLSRLQTDYIDFYLIHGIVDATVSRYERCGAIEFLEEQKRRGRIRYLGFSSHASVASLEHFADLRPWDFVQIQLNYYDWIYGTARGEYEALRARDIPIMVMEPVRGGKLADLGKKGNAILEARRPGASPASWAFRWVASLPGVRVVLSGMSNVEQVRDNVATFEDCEPLEDDEWMALRSAAGIVHGSMVVPCTACRYCTATCPSKIDIPQFMSVYNTLKTEGDGPARDAAARIRSEGTAEDCIGCGACEEHCPQRIEISKIMAELKSAGISSR